MKTNLLIDNNFLLQTWQKLIDKIRSQSEDKSEQRIDSVRIFLGVALPEHALTLLRSDISWMKEQGITVTIEKAPASKNIFLDMCSGEDVSFLQEIGLW